MTSRLHRLTFLILTCALTMSPVNAQPPRANDARPQTTESVLAAYRSAILSRNLDSLTSLFDGKDPALVDKISRQYRNFFSLELDSIAVRFGIVDSVDDTTLVPVYHEFEYVLNDTSQYAAGWSTLKVTDVGDIPAIVAEDDRDYLSVQRTNVNMRLLPDSGVLAASCSLYVTVEEGGEDNLLLLLNRGLKIESIRLNGAEIGDFRRHTVFIEIPLEYRLEPGDSFEIDIDYSGALFNESEAAGFSQVHIGPEGSFASWVTHWYPRNGGGPSKSIGTVHIVTPTGQTVVSNGRAIPPKKVDGNSVLHRFAIDVPQDFTFASADYFHELIDVDGVQLGVYFLEGGRNRVDMYLSRCTEILTFLIDQYGMYPFGSYLLVEIPSSVTGNLGGSSEQGMNLYPTGILDAGQFNLPIVSHELGHSWWDNWVGSADGSIISEGLSQYTAVMCVEHFMGDDSLRAFMKQGLSFYPQSAAMYFERYTGPDATDLPIGEPNTAEGPALHNLADVKGHFVYEMLARKIGRKPFMDGLRRAIDEYANESMSLIELFELWEQASGRDLSAFKDQWFHRTGAPEFALDYATTKSGDKTLITGEVRQLRDIYEVEAEIVAFGSAGEIVNQLQIDGGSTPLSFEVDGQVDSVEFDPYYKVFRYTSEFKNLHLLKTGTNHRVAGRYDSAITVLEEFLRYSPRNLRAYYQRARAFQMLEKYDRAIVSFDSVITLYNEDRRYNWTVPYALLNLARLHVLQGDTASAIHRLDSALAFRTESSFSAVQALRDSLKN